MTITCSNCAVTYPVTTDDFIVTCPQCGCKTFSPGLDYAAASAAGTDKP